MKKVFVTLVMLSALQVSARHKHRHNKSCPQHLGIVKSNIKSDNKEVIVRKYDCDTSHTIKNGWDTVIGHQTHR